MEKDKKRTEEIKHTMVSIDLDYLDESELSRTLKLLEKNKFDKNVWFDVSPGMKGYHLTAWCNPEDGLTLKQLFCLRRICFDDSARIFLDAMGERQVGVLFDFKKKIVRKGVG